MHSKCTAWGCRIMVSVGKSSPLFPLCLLRARSILGCHCLWWFVLQLHQGLAGVPGSSSRDAGNCYCSLAHGTGDFPAAQPAPPPA